MSLSIALTTDERIALDSSIDDGYSGYVWVCDVPGYDEDALGTPHPLIGWDTPNERFVLLASPGSLASLNPNYEPLAGEASGMFRRFAEAGWRGRVLHLDDDFTRRFVLPYNQSAANRDRIFYAYVTVGSDRPVTRMVRVGEDGCWYGVPVPDEGGIPEIDNNPIHYSNDQVLLTGLWEPDGGPDDEEWTPVSTNGQVTVEQVQAELAAFKEQVRQAVIREGKRRNWCSEADTWLIDLGLPPRQVMHRVRATFQAVVEFDVRTETSEEAEQYVRDRMRTRMAVNQLNTATAVGGGYVNPTITEVTATVRDDTNTDPVF